MVPFVVCIPRVGGRAILAADATTLPMFDATDEARPDEIGSRIAALLTVEPTILRVAQVAGGHDAATLMVVEIDGVDVGAPDGFTWLPIEAVDPAAVRPADIGPHIAAWLGSLDGRISERRAPWARPGWMTRASAWMTHRMAEIGRPLQGPPRLHAIWSISAILRAPTADGAVFLKSCAPVFQREPLVTTAIAERSPAATVRVLATEPTEGWLLLADFGGRILDGTPREGWPAAFAAFASIQRAWDGAAAELERAGAAVRPVSGLARRIHDLPDRLGLGDRLDADEVAAIVAALPGFVAACERLERLGPPATLIHGDLHAGNIAVTDEGPVVFDWSDAAVSHPFLDLPAFIRRIPELALRHAVVDAFLGRWSDTLSEDGLAEAGRLALVVGSLLQVESYEAILASLDPVDRWDMADADVSWLRFARLMLEQGIAGGTAAREGDEVT